jgi:hypothetical protein
MQQQSVKKAARTGRDFDAHSPMFRNRHFN